MTDSEYICPRLSCRRLADQARIWKLDEALNKTVQIAENYATAYSAGKPDDWGDRADNMMWGMARDIAALKPEP
jgi:hypothetical protein